MTSCECFLAACGYPVEISGWDAAENFFVEKCDLAWSEESGKQVELRRGLRENAVLFVRLLRTDEGERSHPVVYEAEWLGKSRTGLNQFRLNAIIPAQRVQELTTA